MNANDYGKCLKQKSKHQSCFKKIIVRKKVVGNWVGR